MRCTQLTLTLAAGLFSMTLHAQITPIGTSSYPMRFITTLMAGPKLFELNHVDTIILRDPDMSVYAIVPLPPPPVGFSYEMNTPLFMTETLFDTDPSNFEFVMQMHSAASDGCRILRQDGTVLFSHNSQSMRAQGGSSPFDAQSMISSTSSGTIMSLFNPYTSIGTQYLLPGDLPCISCATSEMGMTPNETTGMDRLIIFPDPSSGIITIRTSDGTFLQGNIMIHDAASNVIFTGATPHENHMDVDVRNWAPGQYHVRIAGKAGEQSFGRFIVL